jgi:hypothetical protein
MILLSVARWIRNRMWRVSHRHRGRNSFLHKRFRKSDRRSLSQGVLLPGEMMVRKGTKVMILTLLSRVSMQSGRAGRPIIVEAPRILVRTETQILDLLH